MSLHPVFGYVQRNIAGQLHDSFIVALAGEDHVVLIHLFGMVSGAGVVEFRIALHVEVHLSSNHGNLPDQGAFIFLVFLPHRHKIGDFYHAFVGQKAGEQYVGIGQVLLFVLHFVQVGRNSKASSLLYGLAGQRTLTANRSAGST